MTAAGEQKIIIRNKDTAYLTKYLRAYGGTGYINGNKIGRVLRDFVFSGKGLVTNPANKKSVILSTVGNTQFDPTETVQAMENEEMTIDQKMYDDLKSELAAAKAEILTYKSKTDESVANALKAEIDSLTSKNAALANELDSYKKLSTDKDGSIADLKKSVDEANVALASTKQELVDIQANITKTNRIAKLVKAGLEEAKAEEVFNKFATASDEAFNEVVNYQTLIVSKPTETLTEPVTEEVVTDIETASAETKAPLNIPVVEKSKQLHAKFAEWFSNK
jgi:chromosome segregation ATPase